MFLIGFGLVPVDYTHTVQGYFMTGYHAIVLILMKYSLRMWANEPHRGSKDCYIDAMKHIKQH